MKLSLALLTILILAGIFYMHHKTETEAKSFDQEFDNYLEQTSGWECLIYEKCRIGSVYKFNEGCGESIFTNS